MPDFEVNKMQNNNIAFLHATRGEIDMSPPYQRQGAIWSIGQQQLLIDSIINGFDVPKIYLHKFPNLRTLEDGRRVRYALIDGKQRLEAIFGFMDGEFTLDPEFELLRDSSVPAKGRTYAQLQKEQPMLISRFNATNLDVVTVSTDDVELIEEMFSRLNEAAPLNAAEKRNALGGPCPVAVRDLSKTVFFEAKLPFKNSRFRHYDLAAKFLYWENQLRVTESEDKMLRDAKKYRLDSFFREMKNSDEGASIVAGLTESVDRRLNILSATFIDGDHLLASIGMVSVYFLLAQKRASEGRDFPARTIVEEFEDGRRLPRVADEDELGRGEYQLLEFNRLAQSPNDGSALTYRLCVLDAYCTALEAGTDPLEAVVAATRTMDE